MSEAEKTQTRAAETPDPPHLTDLADGWKTWRTFCLRGAGVPVKLLERICVSEVAEAVDAFLDRETAVAQLRGRALARLEDLSDTADRESLRALRRLRRRLSKGGRPDSSSDDPELSALLAELAEAEDSRRAAERAAQSALAEAIEGVSAALREVGRDGRFREAVAWQNRAALHAGVDVLLRTESGKRNKQLRRHEQLIASYLQRYCAKNESIGFFGPIGWGTWSDVGPTFQQHVGKGLVAVRKTHFEYWAIAALVEELSKVPELRQWLAPRFDGKLRIDGDRLVDADGHSRGLQPSARHVLAACDGMTAARDIAARLAADPGCSLKDEAEVYTVLETAQERALVSWTLALPVGPAPEARLTEVLATVGDSDLRSRLSEPLRKLVAARDSVAAAAGDAAALDAALGELETTFNQLTGRSPYQHHGRVYAGRTLVYEDCRRDTEVEVGPDLRQRIAPPLALILQSARWFSHSIAARFEQRLNAVFTELSPRYAPEPVPVTALEFLFQRGNPEVPGIVGGVAGELVEKWSTILLPEGADRRVNLSSDDIREEVASTFAVPGPGWPGAHHHSADLLMAVEGGRRGTAGRYLCVLGEVHVTDTMVMRHVVRDFHPRPEEFVAAYRHDVEGPQIYRVTAEDFQGHRKIWDPLLPGDYQLSRDCSPAWRRGEEVLRLADLVIEESSDGLVVRSRDNARRFPALVYFERLLWRESFTEFTLLPARPHTPRIQIDNLVIRRESWRFYCRFLAFALDKAETGRFIAARRWARQFGLPRWVFVRVPQEYKPVYVDFDSPVSVEILAKLVRRALEVAGTNAVLGVSEMLPDPTQSWLVDADGNSYTSELRIVAVDPESWRQSAATGSSRMT